MDIFDRMKNGQPISPLDPEYEKVKEAYGRAAKLNAELNSGYHTNSEAIEILKKYTCSEIDESAYIALPFYTDFGQNIKLGKGVFINLGCVFLDQGGIVVEDDVLFGPRVCLVTSNHPICPSERRTVVSKPIHIKKNAWICANATILPGITIGENSVVAACSVVTRDVLPNTVVAGNPAKVKKEIR